MNPLTQVFELTTIPIDSFKIMDDFATGAISTHFVFERLE